MRKMRRLRRTKPMREYKRPNKSKRTKIIILVMGLILLGEAAFGVVYRIHDNKVVQDKQFAAQKIAQSKAKQKKTTKKKSTKTADKPKNDNSNKATVNSQPANVGKQNTASNDNSKKSSGSKKDTASNNDQTISPRRTTPTRYPRRTTLPSSTVAPTPPDTPKTDNTPKPTVETTHQDEEKVGNNSGTGTINKEDIEAAKGQN